MTLVGPALARHLEEPIVVADIGCRWGFSPLWDRLHPHVSLVGFDADEDEVVRLREQFADREHMTFVAQALGATRGRMTLFRTREPSGTSVFRPALADTAHLPSFEGAVVDSTVEVEIATLDDWASEHGGRRIDALKLDTQGSELDILRGGVRCLRDIRHVEVEVSFNTTSEDAPLFGEVDAFLRQEGFALWRLRDLAFYCAEGVEGAPDVTEGFWFKGAGDPVHYPVELASGQLFWCNAHFVKRDLYERDPALGWQTRLRDACIVDALGFHDLTMLALTHLLREGAPAEVRQAAEETLEAVASSPAGPESSRSRAGRALGRLRRLVVGRSHA